MWEAADVQWWWRRPRATDDLALPVWFDDARPRGGGRADGLGRHLAGRRVRGPVDRRREDVWAATLEAAAGHPGGPLQVLVRQVDVELANLAIQSGFAMTDELSGTTWMDADQRPSMEQVDGFAIVDRAPARIARIR